jgi:ribosomal-protein-alanine N-acetyltransferase
VNVLETERLILRQLTADDDKFILELVNEPSWLRNIGDRGVKTPEHARAYLQKGPIEMYHRLGFGLYLVELKEKSTALGICGLIKRDTLTEVDLGFAFLSRFQAQGYGFESATGVLAYGKQTLGLTRILAVTSQDNQPSSKLLGKLGFHFEQSLRLSPNTAEVKLYAIQL